MERFEDGDIRFLAETMIAICGSPAVNEFIIGLSRKPITRRDRYLETAELGYVHFVILDTELEADDAEEIEKFSQAEKSKHPDCYRKYNKKRANVSYRANFGGHKASGAVYSVYMAWK